VGHPSVNWPVGVGGKGNERRGRFSSSRRRALSAYVELIYAPPEQDLVRRRCRTPAGEWVRASTETVSNAAGGGFEVDAEGLPRLDHQTPRVTTSTRSRRSPGCSCRTIPATKQRAKMLGDFIKWALTDGQQDCARRSATRRCRRKSWPSELQRLNELKF